MSVVFHLLDTVFTFSVIRQQDQLEKAPRYTETETPEYTDEYGRRVYDYYGVTW